MDRDELFRLQELVRITRDRVRSTREQAAKTWELLTRHRRERLGREVEVLSPQDRQYATIRAWIDRNGTSDLCSGSPDRHESNGDPARMTNAR